MKMIVNNMKRFQVIPNVGIKDTLTGEVMTTTIEYCHSLNRQDENTNNQISELMGHMNITDLLSKELDTESKQICVNITTITDIYSFCFIEYEDCEKIGVYITGKDGRERYMIIMKDQIVAVQVIYEQDIQIKEDHDVMVL